MRDKNTCVPRWMAVCICMTLSVTASCPQCACNPGYTVDGSDECTKCAPGKYKDLNGTSPCVLCPYAKFSNTTGATSVDTCTPCPLWHFADKGSRCATDCIAPANPIQQQRKSPTCTAVLPDCVNDGDCGGAGKGTCNPSNGQCECRRQFRGRHCSLCQLGFVGENCSVACSLQGCSGHGRCRVSAICDCVEGYIATSDYTCAACPTGTFANRTGLTECFRCPLHSDSPVASTAEMACSCNLGYSGPQCLPCSPGTYKEVRGSAPCTLCAAGKYSTERGGKMSNDSCLDCPQNTYSAKGSDVITKCTCHPGENSFSWQSY